MTSPWQCECVCSSCRLAAAVCMHLLPDGCCSRHCCCCAAIPCPAIARLCTRRCWCCCCVLLPLVLLSLSCIHIPKMCAVFDDVLGYAVRRFSYFTRDFIFSILSPTGFTWLWHSCLCGFSQNILVIVMCACFCVLSCCFACCTAVESGIFHLCVSRFSVC